MMDGFAVEALTQGDGLFLSNIFENMDFRFCGKFCGDIEGHEAIDPQNAGRDAHEGNQQSLAEYHQDQTQIVGV